MGKRIFSLLLCLALVLTMAAPAAAATKKKKKKEAEPEKPPVVTLEIASTKEFLDFAETCRLDSASRNLEVHLKADLDLTGTDFAGVPIFCGSFQGGGHTISGLELTMDGSSLGLFRYLTPTAQVLDLKVKGTVTPGGSREEIGGIAGSNAGLIRGCSFEGSVSGGSKAGGIAGFNAITGVIEGCQARGTVDGSHFVGGIAGRNQGVLRSCLNYARINTTPQENTVSLTDVTLENMTGAESAATVTDIGGITGSSTGVIRDCTNHADVGYQHMGYNIGGIAGTQAGYIGNCENQGSIRGRKEVGGIVGQMEPTARIIYDEDTLQILKGQLEEMSGTVTRTAANVQNAGKNITGHISALGDDIYTAGKALESLMPEDMENPTLPDQGTLEAAKTNLSNSLYSMMGTMNRMNATTMSSIGVLSNNLNTLQRQINGMSQTLGNAEETLGGSVEDVSDSDTPGDLTGKVENCRNFGPVLADLNAGGIVGAMAVENDLDPEEDMEIEGGNSLNFESKLRAVILNCENQGSVTLNKQGGGGIVGWQSLGLVKNSWNTGEIQASGASHIGGISGRSTGYIRACYANCVLTGDSHVGGIAGSAPVVTDCRSLVRLDNVKEKGGAILGSTEENTQEVEAPIAGNYYLKSLTNIGAIDGISYDGQAQPLEEEAFFKLEGLPEIFSRALVMFYFESGTRKVLQIPTGEALKPEDIPLLPEKEHFLSHWEGLAEADTQHIYFDLTFRAKYTGMIPVIQNEAEPSEAQPKLLLQGEFTPSTRLTVRAMEIGPDLWEEDTLLETWSFSLSENMPVTAGRLRLPEDCDGKHLKVMLRRNGVWEERALTVDGSYGVFQLDGQADAVALVQGQGENWYLQGAVAGGAGLALLLILLLIRSARKKKKAK